MKRIIQIISISILALATSCAGTGGHTERPLLQAVPSDAIATGLFSNCQDALECMLDSASVFNRIDYGQLRKSPVALSYCYASSLTPILSLEAGKAEADTLPDADNVISQAAALGLHAECFRGALEDGLRNVVVITPSESILHEMRRHIDGSTSIMDTPDFQEAVNIADGCRDVIFFRNSGIGRLLPRNFEFGIFDRKTIVSFMQKAAQWTVLIPEGRNRALAVRTYQNEGSAYFAGMLETLGFEESRLGAVLPAGTDFAMTVAVSDQFRKSYEEFLDANRKLEKYRKTLKELKGSTGTDPLKWEKKNDIREVALVSWENRTVVMMRPRKKAEAPGLHENPFPGYPSALYGEAFRLPDSSAAATVDGWIVTGSGEDVEAFAVCAERMESSPFESKTDKAAVYTGGNTLQWGKKGIRYGRVQVRK